jgi:hypothetical protein
MSNPWSWSPSAKILTDSRSSSTVTVPPIHVVAARLASEVAKVVIALLLSTRTPRAVLGKEPDVT